MKRFKIKNLVNGLEFQVERQSIEPLQPEWGKPAWTETVIDEPERTETVVIQPEIKDAEGNVTQPEITEERIVPAVTREIVHAAEYEITEEDMSAEIAAKKLKEDELKQAEKDFKALVNKSTATTAEILKGLKDLSKLLAK